MRSIDARWVIAAGATVLATAAAYALGLGGPFLYDDIRQIVTNRELHDPFDLESVIFNGERQIRVWQNISFAVNWAISPHQTWSFKVVNFLLHVLNAALWWRLLRRAWPARPRIADLTTVLFLLHPLQVQSVAYVMGRVSLLQACFYLLALNLIAGTGERRWLVGGVIAASLVAKESCALIPLAIVLYELTVGRRSWREVLGVRTALRFASALLLVPLLWLLRDPVSMYRGTSGFDLMPYGEYLVTQLHYLAVHPYLMLSPAAQSFIHPPPVVTGRVIAWAVVGALVGAGLLVAAWRSRRRAPLVAFAVAFYFLSMAPTSSLVQMKNPFAEYRLYQANAVWLLLLVLGGAVLTARSKPWVRTCIFVVAVGYFAVFTAFHNRIYGDALRVYSYALEVYPWSSELHVLVGSQRERRGELEDAEIHFRHAAELTASEVVASARPRFRLARLYSGAGRYQEAWEQLEAIPTARLRYGAPPREYFEVKLEVALALARYADLARTLDRAEQVYGPGAFAPFTWGR